MLVLVSLLTKRDFRGETELEEKWSDGRDELGIFVFIEIEGRLSGEVVDIIGRLISRYVGMLVGW